MDLFHLVPIASCSTPLVFAEPFFPLPPPDVLPPFAAIREETDYQFEIILYMHRIFQMFEFAASGGAVSQKRLHQKRSLFSNCLVVFSGKFKHLKYSVRV